MTRKRNPNGVDVDSPIALRLMPTERKEATELSKRYNRTESAFARKCYLIGVQVLKDAAVSSPADTCTAVSKGGVNNDHDSAASFSSSAAVMTA